jgi:peptidoglycan/xylan/chitin deacetylase (PgdA/CDA1 family)
MSIVDNKGRILKFSISALWFMSDYVLRLFMRLLGRMPNATCVILYYHSVSDVQKLAFVRQLDIVTSMTIPISIDHVPKLLPGKRYSAITFDDGFENIITNAVPELSKRGIPATVFVTSGYLGRPAEWWPKTESERQLKIGKAEKWQQLQADLISIGSHTITHPYLTALSEPEAKSELFESRAMLQELLKRKINTFSFPYGDFNAALIDWCREAGYKRIFTSLPENSFKKANEFVSGRIKVEPTDWPLEFRLKLLGAYSWLPLAISWKRRILSLSLSMGLKERVF